VFVALLIQQAKGIFLSLASLAVLYCILLSHKRQDVSEKELFNKKYVLISSTTDTFLALRRIQWDVTKTVHKSSCTVFVRF